MNTARRPGSPRRRDAHLRAPRRRARAGLAAAVAVVALAAGCARFPDSAPIFSAQPSLSPNIATIVTPTPAVISASRSSPSSRASQSPPPSGSTQSPSTSTSTSADPCGPSMPPVVATCLTTPWGLAPLPDGQSALVGERTTGRILQVTPGRKPQLITTITGLDTSGDGGLLGIALSPYYTEDNLIYAYVTTPTDNRILRIAPGQQPKAIFTGIPAGNEHNGGSIAFGSDDLLYVATGDTGDPELAADPDSLAGKVLRLDTFGKPATGNRGADGATDGASGSAAATTGSAPSSSGSPTGATTGPATDTAAPSTAASGGPGASSAAAIYASGFSDPTGICPLPGGQVGTIDHRGTGDLLIPVLAGRNYAHPTSADTLWVYQAGDGGAVDCAVAGGYLMSSSLAAQKVISIQMTPTGGFTGSPQDVAAKQFGRLLTIVAGTGDLVWLTTSNRDGHGEPVPSDDRVIVLPAGGGGGGGGGAD